MAEALVFEKVDELGAHLVKKQCVIEHLDWKGLFERKWIWVLEMGLLQRQLMAGRTLLPKNGK